MFASVYACLCVLVLCLCVCCVVLVCVSGNDYIVIVGVCVGVCMFVNACAIVW